MLAPPALVSLILTGPFLAQMNVESAPDPVVDSSYFEGRWAFEEESCEEPSNWTMIAGGNFVSDDLIGMWGWNEGRLTLNLTDLAIDEETGEAGGKFLMDGPIDIVDANAFRMTVQPAIYSMKR